MVERDLPPAVRASLARFRASLAQRFGARLREVVLFGSYARGDADEESDVDVLVVVDGLADEELLEVASLANEADAADRPQWAGLAPFACSSERAADMRRRERLLFRDIDREGIAL